MPYKAIFWRYSLKMAIEKRELKRKLGIKVMKVQKNMRISVTKKLLWINSYRYNVWMGMNIHKSQLVWCEQGYRVLTCFDPSPHERDFFCDNLGSKNEDFDQKRIRFQSLPCCCGFDQFRLERRPWHKEAPQRMDHETWTTCDCWWRNQICLVCHHEHHPCPFCKHTKNYGKLQFFNR